MKVLEKGKPQKGWSIETRCTGAGNGNGGCEALLLVEQDDLFRTTSHARDETTYYVTFRCPECGVMTDIQNSDYGKRIVPPHLTIATGVKHPDGGFCHPDMLVGTGTDIDHCWG